jgi:hypothetical protein
MSFSPLLALHISAGIVGILSGAAAMSFRKGSPRHALAGKVFVISMLTMAATAVYLAVTKHQTGNVLGGAFTLSGGYGMADRQAQRRRNKHLRLARASTSFGGRDCPLDFGGTGGASPDMVRKRSSCWGELFHGLRAAACCRGRRSHGGARRSLRRTAYHAASLAHVFWAVHRHRVFLPRTGQQGIPFFSCTIKRTFCPGAPAIAIADFLAIPSSLHKCIPEKIDAAWRCLLLTDLASSPK